MRGSWSVPLIRLGAVVSVVALVALLRLASLNAFGANLSTVIVTTQPQSCPFSPLSLSISSSFDGAVRGSAGADLAAAPDNQQPQPSCFKTCGPTGPVIPINQPCPATVIPTATVVSVPATPSPIPNQVCPGNVLVPQNQSCPQTSTTNPGSGTGGSSNAAGQTFVPILKTPSPTPSQVSGAAPSTAATVVATSAPTSEPTSAPTIAPTSVATAVPTTAPTTVPTRAPTSAPPTRQPQSPATPPTNAPPAGPSGACPGASNVPVSVTITPPNPPIPRLANCPGPESITVNLGGSGTTALVALTNVAQPGHTANLNATVVIDLQPGVTASNVQVSAGAATVQANRVIWNNFSLASGQQATAAISLVATGGPAASAANVPAIRSVSIDAIDQATGQRITETSGPGGPALAAQAAAAPPAAGAVSAAAAAPAPVAGAPAAPGAAAVVPPALPRTGGPVPDAWLPAALFGGILSLVGGFWLMLRRLDQSLDR